MKKLITLSFITVAIATPMLNALEFDSLEEEDAFYAEQSKILSAVLDGIDKALTDNDDFALKEAIFEISYNAIGYAGVSVDIFRGFMCENVIHSERITKVLQNIIRQGLPDLLNEDDEKRRRAGHDVYLAAHFLEVLPSAETVVLLKECIQSQNEAIRIVATKSYNNIMEKTQNSTKNELTLNSTLEIPPPLKQPKKTSPNKLFWGFVFIVIIAIIGGAIKWKKKNM